MTAPLPRPEPPRVGRTLARRVVDALYPVRWLLLALLVPVVVLAGFGASRVGIDNAVTVWFVDDDPALEVYRGFQEIFGNDEVVVLAVHDPGGILDPGGLARVAAVSEAAAGTDGIAEVVSVSTVDHVRVDERWVPTPDEAPPMVIGPVVDQAAADVLRARILGDPLLRGRLVSDDGTTALVFARMDDFRGMDARRDGILADLGERVDEAARAHVPTAGIGVIFSALNVASSRDAVVVGAASYGVILLLLLVLMGRTGPVVLTLAVVAVSVLIAAGIQGAAGRDLNMVTMALPTLVLIIAVADCIHILERVREEPEGPQEERVRAGVAAVLWPCLFTSLTTAAGFVALGTARMQVVRDLGWFAAAGVMVAFVVTLVVMLPLLRYRVFEPTPRSGRRTRAAILAVARWSVRQRRGVLGGCVLMLLAGAWGVSKLDVDTYSIDYFYPGHVVREDSAFIEEAFGPYTPLELVVVAPGGLRDAESLAAVARWQDAMEADPRVGWTRSVVGTVRRLNQVLTDGAPASFVVPQDDLALEQALFLYESDPDARLDDLVTPDWSRLRVTVGLEMMSARDIGEAIEGMTALAELPPGVTVEAAGYLPLYVTMMDYVVTSQVNSFAGAFLLIFGLLAVLFRSVRMTLLAVPTNLLPVFVTLGLMGVAGIRLDVATVTIAAIVLGLVVDDTTHFLYRFRERLRATDDHELAIEQTLEGTGLAMTITTIVLVVGFSVLGLATVKSVAFFGLLSAMAMGSAMVAEIVLMPALLVTLRPKL